MTIQVTSAPDKHATRTGWHPMLGGCAALGFWEVWANWPTQLFAGYPLEPHELICLRIFGHPMDDWAIGIGTYFLALAFFAPLAGYPFLLIGDNWRSR
jgi:hypothetical protein